MRGIDIMLRSHKNGGWKGDEQEGADRPSLLIQEEEETSMIIARQRITWYGTKLYFYWMIF